MANESQEPSGALDTILRRRRRRTLLRALAAGLALAGGLIYLWLRSPERRDAPIPPPSPAQAPSAPASPSPAPDPSAASSDPSPTEAESEAARPLPPLGESDPLVRELAARLSSRPELVVWLASDELIRRIVAGVDAVAQGQSPVDQAPASMRLQGRFEVVTSDAGAVAAPSAHARYDLLTDVVSGLDGEGLAQAYRRLAPLFDEAHRALGHPSGSFAAALRTAIFELLAAPTVLGQPLLVPLEPGYGYADPALEDLSSAKKQLLRFGPGNVPRIQHALQALARALGIPESELPRSPIWAAES